MTHSRRLFACLLLLAVFAGQSAAQAPAQPSDFAVGVLPILQARCLRCHGEKKQSAELDLRTKAAMLKGGENGPALRPGALKDSLLWQKIHKDEMPPGKDKLAAAEKEAIRRWIEAGAPAAESAGAASSAFVFSDEERSFWAFRTPVRPPVPPIRNLQSAIRNPIDAFILAALEQKGLTFAPPAERATLLRRVTFDLTGLPPTPEELERFLADSSPQAYAQVVDRLLASPQYGERWARHWLDLAGYADSEGILDADYVRSAAWRYRDYVIRAFNQDKAYDRFLQEQIAGDELVDYWTVYEKQKELPADVVECLTATGYLRCASDTSRPDFVNIKNAPGYYYQTLDDTLKIVVSSTMGLTIQCAKCHSHKYDPIPHTNYYQMQALFMTGYRPAKWVPQVQRFLPAGTAQQVQETKAHNARIDTAIAALKKQQQELQQTFATQLFEQGLAKLPENVRADVKAALALDAAKRSKAQQELAAKYQTELKPAADVLAKKLANSAEHQAKLAELTQAMKQQEGQKRTLAEIRAFYDLPGEVKTPLLRRGEYTQPGPEVAPNVLAVLANAKAFQPPVRAKDAKTSGLRLAFAQWLTRPDHPLTARVFVNRIWLHHFGRGLVATPDNFGRTGTAPSHPELLDWLATEFMNPTHSKSHAWGVKALHRLIVTSATYQQSSQLNNAAKSIDPENRLLWRQRLRRLDAEALRDAMLHVAGTLNPQMYGTPVTMLRIATGEVTTASDAASQRRSIYLQVRRSQPHTFLQLFDQPVIETNCTQRENSTVASQALTLLNSEFTQRQAEALAGRILKEAAGDRAQRAVLLAFGRAATGSERQLFQAFLEQQTQQYAKTQPAEAPRRALADLCHMLMSANEFAYVD